MVKRLLFVSLFIYLFVCLFGFYLFVPDAPARGTQPHPPFVCVFVYLFVYLFVCLFSGFLLLYLMRQLMGHYHGHPLFVCLFFGLFVCLFLLCIFLVCT